MESVLLHDLPERATVLARETSSLADVATGHRQYPPDVTHLERIDHLAFRLLEALQAAVWAGDGLGGGEIDVLRRGTESPSLRTRSPLFEMLAYKRIGIGIEGQVLHNDRAGRIGVRQGHGVSPPRYPGCRRLCA